MMTAPCQEWRDGHPTSYPLRLAGRPFDGWCDDCQHALIAHRRDGVCSVCEAVGR